jgi:hypothetical protein
VSKSAELAKYGGIEQFVTAPPQAQPGLRAAIEHHLVLVRSRLARELWGRELFVGVSVLDDLLFRSLVSGKSSPVLETLELIRDNGLHHPGFVIFPVHSFGVLGAAALDFFAGQSIEFTSASFGLVLSPQTNSLEKTIAVLERARQAFGIRKCVPAADIEHWYQSRAAHWLTRNPLLIVKTRSFPGEYYENQFLVVSKLRQMTALVSMLATLQPPADQGRRSVWSSSTMNNFQTLDLRHYLVLFNAPGSRRELRGDCVPMHLTTPEFAELSDLGIELDPRHWRRREPQADRIKAAIDTVYDGYLKFSFGSDRETVRGRVYRKLFESTAFFRRSFHRTGKDWSAFVSLAVAFEMLLTDGYAPGATQRIHRRARLVLQGTPGVRTYVKAVKDLFAVRGATVHSGSAEETVDMHVARRAFVHAFVTVSARLHKLAPTSQQPMRDLTGDR